MKQFPAPVFDDALEGRERAAEAKAERQEAARQEFRATFPQVTAVADELRRVFGDGVRIRWAIENGFSVGAVPQTEREQHEREHGPVRELWRKNASDQNPEG